MMELYNSSKAFRDYVDRYCQKHKLRVSEALEHKLVQEAGEQYGQMEKAQEENKARQAAGKAQRVADEVRIDAAAFSGHPAKSVKS